MNFEKEEAHVALFCGRGGSAAKSPRQLRRSLANFAGAGIFDTERFAKAPYEKVV
jgi:hypothetical protein